MFKQLVVAFALSPLALQASNLPDYPFIHVSGEGMMRIAPDLGEIDFDISAYDPDPAAAAAIVGERAGQVRALLAGVDAVTEIHNPRKEMRKADQPDASGAPAYDIRSSVHIAVRDLGQWRAVMQGLLALPNLDHLATTFGRTDRLQAEQELTAIAVQDAQRRAAALAAGFGRKVGAVAAVSSGQLRNLTNAVGLMPGDLYFRRDQRTVPAQAPDKDFLATELLSWTQTVDVIFRIK
ncbi:DUF541 domain-containing protein [Pseudoduganella sp. FT25W]|uniref:DUF541 domain-containing protein n=1 Tax=Duganella alba TaxID=2666081 RepID=A0A6L5QGD5_9BURK|nr:SIMPL domain-containing protein [Duganella alba]MRX08834.1 DUF541 domain-containing protein [Duganella alba]MRX18872.1 DUF541 domain-containing protein [Duganella alba]